MGKLWDLTRMFLSSLYVALTVQPSLLHVRGHAPAQVGLLLKFLFGYQLLFDCRGLWVDERLDKGGWDLSCWTDRLQYTLQKKIERVLFRHSDHIVVLTNAMLSEAKRLGATSTTKITVIPCCVDYQHFALATPDSKYCARRQLSIPQKSLVFGYLGSVGEMYLPQQFIKLVVKAHKRYPNSQALVLTPQEEAFKHILHDLIPASTASLFSIHTATRDQVPCWLPAVDILVAFVRPGYARISMSPTKLPEAWATGIPTVCSSYVGDTISIIKDLDSGLAIDPLLDSDLQSAIDAIPHLLEKSGLRLRNAARSRFSLETGTTSYKKIYALLRASCLT